MGSPCESLLGFSALYKPLGLKPDLKVFILNAAFLFPKLLGFFLNTVVKLFL